MRGLKAALHLEIEPLFFIEQGLFRGSIARLPPMKCFVPFVAIGLLSGCASSGPQDAKGANDAKCPDGQTFDGEYCQVDQSVATQETKVSAPQESEAGPGEGKPEDAAPAESGGEAQGSENVPVVPTLEAPGQGTLEGEEGEVAVGEEEEPEEEAELQSAAPVDYAMAAQAAPVMHYLASSHLPSGARPLGAPFAGQFAAGQILEQKVQLTAGKCYTVVAMGLPPITEVNLELREKGQEEPLAEDDGQGPQAVLGSRSSCFKPEKSGPVTLRLHVTGGQGVAAAQVFQK